MNVDVTTPENSGTSSTDAGSALSPTPPSPLASRKPWSGLGYEMVPGLANRLISRYLRGQRRNMERFFTERGLHDSALRMRQIRLSRQGMLAKNRMFQEVLNEYARRASPQPVAEAANLEGSPSPDVVLPAEARLDSFPVHAAGDGTDAGAGVQVVASEDSAGIVIEE
jgi:hypothetical protein